jgi:hypothetical protein
MWGSAPKTIFISGTLICSHDFWQVQLESWNCVFVFCYLFPPVNLDQFYVFSLFKDFVAHWMIFSSFGSFYKMQPIICLTLKSTFNNVFSCEYIYKISNSEF